MSIRKTVTIVLCIEAAIALAILLHVGENIAPGVSLYKFSPLLGTAIGCGLTFFALRKNNTVQTEPWLGNERLGWLSIGCAQLIWGIGESFWRYYSAIGQTPFPSLADAGYVWFPALCFLGLLVQPQKEGRLERVLVALDSLIVMGALLAISWYVLLGKLSQAPTESAFTRFLVLYYPAADTLLLSCVIFLLMRTQDKIYQVTARKFSLLTLGLGLCFFAASDFYFNLQQNAGTYVDGTIVDLGWPLGMITIGLAAYLRSALPITNLETLAARQQQAMTYMGFRPQQLLPYATVPLLFFVVILNVLSTDQEQASIRVVLILTTVGVTFLIILRQLLTIRENDRLTSLQLVSLQQIEAQARQITERNKELEEGISHLKEVQTSLANGNLRARAQMQHGLLWSLASSLNLLAERLTSLGMAKRHLDQLQRALQELAEAIARYRSGQPFQLPASCQNVPEVAPIVHAIGAARQPINQLTQTQDRVQRGSSSPERRQSGQL